MFLRVGKIHAVSFSLHGLLTKIFSSQWQICELEPSFFRDCDALVRDLQGRLDILAVNVHLDSDTQVDHYDDLEEESSSVQKEYAGPTTTTAAAATSQLSEKLQKQTISSSKEEGSSVKQQKCSTCNAFVGDAKEYREHFKSEWHKHNMRRKTRQLPPLSAEECLGDMDIDDSKSDLKDYSF